MIATEKSAIKVLFLFIYFGFLEFVRFKDAMYADTVAVIIFVGIFGKNRSNDHLVLP